MTTCSSVLTWRIPRTEEPGCPWGHTESDRTEQVNSTLNTPKMQGCELSGEGCCAHTLPVDQPPPSTHWVGNGCPVGASALRQSEPNKDDREGGGQPGRLHVGVGQPDSEPHPGLPLTPDLSSQEDPVPEKQQLQTLPEHVRRPELCPTSGLFHQQKP